MNIIIPVSVGELLDKISILKIKSQYTDSLYVIKELNHLTQIAKENKVYDSKYFDKLLNVNQKLWKIEDELRVLERLQNFDDLFVNLARDVYITNDIRASIKKEINQKYNSSYREVKIHK